MINTQSLHKLLNILLLITLFTVVISYISITVELDKTKEELEYYKIHSTLNTTADESIEQIGEYFHCD